jgi:hypothetical protein
MGLDLRTFRNDIAPLKSDWPSAYHSMPRTRQAEHSDANDRAWGPPGAKPHRTIYPNLEFVNHRTASTLGGNPTAGAMPQWPPRHSTPAVGTYNPSHSVADPKVASVTIGPPATVLEFERKLPFQTRSSCRRFACIEVEDLICIFCD